MKYYGYFLLLLGNVFFFFLTDSKTSLLAIGVTIILALFTNDRVPSVIKKVSAWCGMGITAFSIIFSVLTAGNAYRVYNYDWYGDRAPLTCFFAKLNQILNGRIRILTGTYNFEGTTQTWSLFSKPENNYFFDMGWVRLFYWYGIIPGCIFVIALLIMLVYCYRKKQYTAIVMVASFALYSIIEAHAFSVYLGRNYVFFLLGLYWYQILRKEEQPV